MTTINKARLLKEVLWITEIIPDDIIDELLSCLNERERRVVEQYFGEPRQSLAQIAKELPRHDMGKGVTLQRARQILNQAVHRLRRHNSRRGLLRRPYEYDEELRRKIRKKELESKFGIPIPGELHSLQQIQELYEKHLQACRDDKVSQVRSKEFSKELADFYNRDTNDVEFRELERRLGKKELENRFGIVIPDKCPTRQEFSKLYEEYLQLDTVDPGRGRLSSGQFVQELKDFYDSYLN
jgi:hypothetical protein